MGFFDQPFVADESAASGNGFAALPVGTYNFIINKISIGPSKSKGLEQVAIELVVDSGQYAGRKVFKYIGVENPDPAKVARAKREMHALVILCGLKSIDCCEDLLGKTFESPLHCKKDESTGEITNVIWFNLPPKNGGPVPKADPAPKTTPANRQKW